MRNNSAECFIGNAEGVFRAREIRRLEPQDRRDIRTVHSVIGVPWRMTDGRWAVDRPEVRVDPIPIPPLPFEGTRIQRERITKQDIDEFGATIGCPGCNAIKDNKRAQAHSDRCRKRIEECLRNISHGAERLDRRDEVINEALAEEVRRGEQRKKRSDGTTAAVPETGSAAPEPMAGSAAPELREDPIEPDPNPKRRVLMKSASSTASGSGQQREKRPIPDGESRMQVEDMSETGTGEGTALPAAPSANTRRRIVVKSEPMAVTTQEAVDGSREKKAMRIASVQQVELGNIMELPITGQVLEWARQVNLSGGVSLRKADGWNLKNHSHLTVARHLRKKIHPSMLVVTISEGEERGMCTHQGEDHQPRIAKEHQDVEQEVALGTGRNDVLVKDLGLENGNSVQTPATPEVTEEEKPEPLSQVQHHKYRSQVARCLFLSQDRADITFIVNELCQRMSNPTQQHWERPNRKESCRC